MYDEFGNYVGPELGGEQEGEDSDELSDSLQEQDDSDKEENVNVSKTEFNSRNLQIAEDQIIGVDDDYVPGTTDIVLHEDK